MSTDVTVTDRFLSVCVCVCVCLCVCITAAIGARKPVSARHNDAFVSRDHGQLSATCYW